MSEQRTCESKHRWAETDYGPLIVRCELPAGHNGDHWARKAKLGHITLHHLTWEDE